jgi:hypothetical protein
VAGAVGNLDPFADDEVIEMRRNLGVTARIDVEQQSGRLAWQEAMDKAVGDDARLVGRQEKLAAVAGVEVLDVIGSEVMQQCHGVGAGHFNMAAQGQVEDDGSRLCSSELSTNLRRQGGSGGHGLISFLVILAIAAGTGAASSLDASAPMLEIAALLVYDETVKPFPEAAAWPWPR